MKEMKNIGESTKETSTGNPGGSISEKNNEGSLLTNLSCEEKSSNIHMRSYMKPGYTCDDGHNEGSSESQLVNKSVGSKSDIVNLKSSTERRCSSECMDASELKKVNSEETDILSEDKSGLLCGNVVAETRLSPMITFSRRSKRKKNVDGTNIQSKSLVGEDKCTLLTKEVNSAYGTTSTYEAVPGKGCSGDLSTDLKQSGEGSEVSPDSLFPQKSRKSN